MRRLFVSVLCLATFASLMRSAEAAQTIKVWPGIPPGDQSLQPPPPKAPTGGRANVERIPLVTEPTRRATGK